MNIVKVHNELNDIHLVNVINDLEQKPKPFVKWVGGKRSIMNTLLAKVPEEINNYYEPFVGGGALFFEIYNKIKNKCFLSDLNIDLVISYITIQKQPQDLIKQLEIHQKNHNTEYYLK